MDSFEFLCKLKPAALTGFARTMYEREKGAFLRLVADMTGRGTPEQFEALAEMVGSLTALGEGGAASFDDAKYGTREFADGPEGYISLCEAAGVGEEVYMRVLLAAQYARPGGALRGWDRGVDRYLERLARSDFALAADYIEMYDKRYSKYSVLIKTDKKRALDRLTELAVYGKNIDRAAVRDILLDYPEVAKSLISMYERAPAHDRTSIVRLLLTYKNDPIAREFLQNTCASDSSKSVRDLVAGPQKRTRSRDAASHLETMMAEGVGMTYAKWKELLADPGYAEVAESIFFCTFSGRRVRVLVFDGGDFLDSGDARVPFGADTLIYILHPLDISPDISGIFRARISQPFPQIQRPVYGRQSGEMRSSERLSGTMIEAPEFRANLKKYGFALCDRRYGVGPEVAALKIGGYAVGVEYELPERTDTVRCGRMRFYLASDLVKVGSKLYVSTAEPLDITKMPYKAFSELMYGVYRLFDAT